MAKPKTTPKAAPLVQQIEKAMSEAIHKALADGITDPEKQRKAMLAARQEVLKKAQG